MAKHPYVRPDSPAQQARRDKARAIEHSQGGADRTLKVGLAKPKPVRKA